MTFLLVNNGKYMPIYNALIGSLCGLSGGTIDSKCQTHDQPLF